MDDTASIDDKHPDKNNTFQPAHDDFEQAVDDAIGQEFFLPPDVRLADLTKYADAQLDGRLAQYERDYTFERNQKRRREFQREMERTRIEINRRKLYRQQEAVRKFEL